MRSFCEGGTSTLRPPQGRVGVAVASLGSAHTLERPFQRAKNQVKRTIIGPVRPGGRSPSPSLEGGHLRARHRNAALRACAHRRTRGKVRRHCRWSTRSPPLGAPCDGVARGAHDPHLQGPKTQTMTGRGLPGQPAAPRTDAGWGARTQLIQRSRVRCGGRRSCTSLGAMRVGASISKTSRSG